MKRALVFMFVVFVIFSPITASAKEADGYLSDFSDILPEESREDVSDSDALAEAVGFKAVIEELYTILSKEGERIISFLLMCVGFAVLLSLADAYDGKLAPTVRAGASAVAVTAIFGSIYPLVDTVGSVLSEISGFFEKLIPICAGVTLAGGGSASASVGATGMSITLGVIGGFSSKFLLSAVSLLFALGLVSDVGEGVTGGVFKTVKSVFSWGIGILTFLLGSTLALQTVISSASDSMIMRGVKHTASGMIPIVGSAVSGALGTLASGLTYAKSFIGTGAIAVILGFALAPLILLLSFRFILSLSVDFLDFLGTGRGVRSFSSILGAFDALIAVFAMSTLIYIFEIILFIKSGVAIL